MLLAIIFYSAFPLFTSQPSAVWFLSQQPSDSTLTKATSHLLSAESNEHIPALTYPSWSSHLHLAFQSLALPKPLHSCFYDLSLSSQLCLLLLFLHIYFFGCARS